MTQSILKLELFGTADSSSYRTAFKNRHGRSIYLEVKLDGSTCKITDCFYTDRSHGKAGAVSYYARPKLLRTLTFPTENLLNVMEDELDKHFYGVEFVRSATAELPLEEYLQSMITPDKYHFLIMVGEGEVINDLPARLRTRLKNKLHRSVYLDLEYYKDGKGVVRECYYYDRHYKRQGAKVTPPQLISCFFQYTHSDILNLINNEICCDFTHIIVTSDIDVTSDTRPLCGAL